MGKAFFSSIECRVRQAPQSGTRRKMRERGRKKELENKHSMCDTYHRNAPQVVHTQCSCVRAYVWPISLSAFSVALQLFIWELTKTGHSIFHRIVFVLSHTLMIKMSLTIRSKKYIDWNIYPSMIRFRRDVPTSSLQHKKKTFFVFRAFGRFGSVKADFNSGCDVNQIRRFPPKPLAELSARRKFLRFSKAV